MLLPEAAGLGGRAVRGWGGDLESESAMLVPSVWAMLATTGWAGNLPERLVHPEAVLGDPLLLVLDCSLRGATGRSLRRNDDDAWR